MKILKRTFSAGLITTVLVSCSGGDTNYVPKKYGQMRIELSTGDKNYIQAEPTCNMRFELPDYAVIEEKPAPFPNTCFTDIVIPKHKATINLTYKNLPDSHGIDSLAKYLEDSHRFVNKHLIKADDYFDTLLFDTERRVYAQVFNLTGDVASPVQFVITDSSHNFVRGSLDFYARPNYDSIRPVLEYVRKDIYHMIRTLEWEIKP